MSTYEGTGPFGRSTVAVRVLPASVARMVIGPDEIRDTHRILLAMFGSAGACSALGVAQRMATMLPAAPITCGMAMSAGVNPDRAQTGSGLTGGCLAQPSALAGSAREGCAAGGPACRGSRGGLPLHAAAAMSESAAAASAAKSRYLTSRRYAGHGLEPSEPGSGPPQPAGRTFVESPQAKSGPVDGPGDR